MRTYPAHVVERLAAHRRDAVTFRALAFPAAVHALCAALRVSPSDVRMGLRDWRQARAKAVRGIRRDGDWNWLCLAGRLNANEIAMSAPLQRAYRRRERMREQREHQQRETAGWSVSRRERDGRRGLTYAQAQVVERIAMICGTPTPERLERRRDHQRRRPQDGLTVAGLLATSRMSSECRIRIPLP